MMENGVTNEAILAEIREGFRGAHRRVDDVIARLDQINGKVGRAHDRASALEARVDAHDTMATGAWSIPKLNDPERDPIRPVHVRWMVAIIGGTVGAVLFVLKLLGKL